MAGGAWVTVLALIQAALAYRFSPQVRHLIFHVTDRCPLACRTCFVRPRPDVPDLSVEEAAPFIRRLGRLTIVNLGGGEPFLRDDLPRLCGLFPKPAGISIPTCGWDPDTIVRRTRDILRTTPARRLSLAVSIDGPREVNDAIRGGGSFDRALATLRALLAVPGLRVKVNTVLTQANAGSLLDFMDQIRSEGPCFHSILLVRGEPRDPACALPPLADLERLAPEVVRRQCGYPGEGGGRVGQRYVRALWEVSLRTLREGRQVLPCLGGRAHLVLYANGDVAPCELLPPVGNIRTQTPEAILKGDTLAAALRSIRAGTCHCTHNCNMLENILFNPGMWPALAGVGKAGDRIGRDVSRRVRSVKTRSAKTSSGRADRAVGEDPAGQGPGGPHRRGHTSASLWASVIIPSYGRPADLERCLASLLAQTYPHREVVVVDDASAERKAYAAAARRYGARLIRQPINRGQAAARNRAARECHGDVLIFLDDDTTVQDPHWIARHVAHHARRGDTIVGGRNVFVAPTLPARAWAAVNQSSTDPGRHLEAMNLSLRRTTFERVGGFDEQLRELEDVEFFHRARRLGLPLVYDPDLTVLHHYRTSFGGILRRAFQYGRWAVPVRKPRRLPGHWYLPGSLLASVALLLPLALLHTAVFTGMGLVNRGTADRGCHRKGMTTVLCGPPICPLLCVPFTLCFCLAHAAGMVAWHWRRRRDRAGNRGTA